MIFSESGVEYDINIKIPIHPTKGELKMQTEEQKKVMNALLDYAAKNHKSFAGIAKQLGITQNTISNWKKGASISVRNQEKILKMIGIESSGEYCNVANCACRNTNNPVLGSLLQLLKEFPERDVAKVYAFALELRDNPLQYRYTVAPVAQAAEDQAPFNKF